jgi:hypothetical protein
VENAEGISDEASGTIPLFKELNACFHGQYDNIQKLFLRKK